jgi:hypothetical protein
VAGHAERHHRQQPSVEHRAEPSPGQHLLDGDQPRAGQPEEQVSAQCPGQGEGGQPAQQAPGERDGQTGPEAEDDAERNRQRRPRHRADQR